VIRSRSALGISFLLGAAVLLAGCSGGRVPPPAATVEGSTITQGDVADEVDVFLAVTPSAQTAFEGPSPTDRIVDLNRNALAFLIQQELVDAYAAAHGIAPTAEQLQQGLQQTIADAGGRQALDRELAQRGLTDANLREYQRQLATRQAVAASLAPDGDPQAQNQAFGTWMIQALATASMDVNPRFGALDTQLGQLLPITSTDQLG
jgi:SurA-like N-terminal domain